MKSERRRERELLKRAEQIRLRRPGDDKYDDVFRTWYAVPGFYIFWMCLARLAQAIGRRVRKMRQKSQAPELSLRQSDGDLSPPTRPPLWTVGPKRLE